MMNNIREFEPKLDSMEDDYRERNECSQMREMVNACRKGLNNFFKILVSFMSSSSFQGKIQANSTANSKRKEAKIDQFVLTISLIYFTKHCHDYRKHPELTVFRMTL